MTWSLAFIRAASSLPELAVKASHLLKAREKRE